MITRIFPRLNAGRPVNRSHPLARGLTAWWMVAPMGHPSFVGGPWCDLMGQSHGILNGNACYHGPFGRPAGYGCIDFDGSGDYVDTGTANLAKTNPYPISVSAWVLSDTTAQGFILSKEASVTDTALWNLAIISNVWAFAYGSTGGIVRASAGSMTTGLWTHLVGTFDPNSDVVLYVNGVAAGTTSWGGASPRTANAEQVWIGRFSGGSFPDYYDGKIDDVRIYDRALSANEAHAIYQNSLQGYPGLLARVKPTPFNIFVAPPNYNRLVPGVIMGNRTVGGSIAR